MLFLRVLRAAVQLWWCFVFRLYHDKWAYSTGLESEFFQKCFPFGGVQEERMDCVWSKYSRLYCFVKGPDSFCSVECATAESLKNQQAGEIKVQGLWVQRSVILLMITWLCVFCCFDSVFSGCIVKCVNWRTPSNTTLYNAACCPYVYSCSCIWVNNRGTPPPWPSMEMYFGMGKLCVCVRTLAITTNWGYLSLFLFGNIEQVPTRVYI